MGNKLEDLCEIEMNNQKYTVELNGGTKKEKFDIHIQNESINICLKDYDFSKFTTAVLVANKRMERFKRKYEQSNSI